MELIDKGLTKSTGCLPLWLDWQMPTVKWTQSEESSFSEKNEYSEHPITRHLSIGSQITVNK